MRPIVALLLLIVALPGCATGVAYKSTRSPDGTVICEAKQTGYSTSVKIKGICDAPESPLDFK